MSANDAVYIWSHEHSAWWKPGGYGYTKNALKAGVFLRFEAEEICSKAALNGEKYGPNHDLAAEVIVEQDQLLQFNAEFNKGPFRYPDNDERFAETAGPGSELKHHEYIGDGVYASTDGYHIWLHVGDHRNPPVVALEPEVLQSLNQYSDRLKALAASETLSASPEAPQPANPQSSAEVSGE